MYKGINRFLNRIKTGIVDFSNFLAKTDRTPPEHKSGQPAVKSQRSVGEETDEHHVRRKVFTGSPYHFEEDRPPTIPFAKYHRLALHIGESTHVGHAFVRENSEAILALPNVRRMTCGDIAKHLNERGTRQPISGEWTSTLVYHFTRHYMSVRPPYFAEDSSGDK